MHYILIFLILISSFHCKKKETGEIVSAVPISLVGEVFVLDKSSDKKPLEVFQTKIFPQETLVTGKTGKCILALPGGANLSVFPNSRIQISYSLLNSVEETSVKLTSGKLFLQQKEKLKSNQKLTVISPTLTAGVRGTEFLVTEDQGVDQVVVGEGSVAVTNGKIESVVNDEEKAEVVDENIQVSSISREESSQLNAYASEIETVLQTNKAQMENILENYKLEKERISAEFQAGKEKIQEELNQQKSKDQEKLNQQKEQGKAQVEQVKTTGKQEVEAKKTENADQKNSINSTSKSEMDKIKSGK